jgi:hypothetical protein
VTTLLVQGMDTAWTSSSPARLQVSQQIQPIFGEMFASHQLVASFAVTHRVDLQEGGKAW